MAEDAVERVTRRLALPSCRLLCAAGYEALLRRALHLASRDFAFLSSVPAPRSDGQFHGLKSAVQSAERERIDDGLMDLLTHLLWLLFTFIGQDLTRNLLRQAWPEAEIGPSGFDSDSEETSW